MGAKRPGFAPRMRQLLETVTENASVLPDYTIVTVQRIRVDVHWLHNNKKNRIKHNTQVSSSRVKDWVLFKM